ncbi:MAG: HEAT repeat domain-containing protein [Pirellulales bacterium]
MMIVSRADRADCLRGIWSLAMFGVALLWALNLTTAVPAAEETPDPPAFSEANEEPPAPDDGQDDAIVDADDDTESDDRQDAGGDTPDAEAPDEDAIDLELEELLKQSLKRLDAGSASPPTEQPLLAWHGNLADGLKSAQRSGQPVLVRVGGEFCPWCAKLDLVIAQPELQTALNAWTRVSLDIDKSPEELRGLAVGPIPALRVLSNRGRLLASHDGYLNAEELVDWLAIQLKEAAQQPDDLLAKAEAPSALDLKRLAKTLAAADPALREAAIRRLLPHRQMAAGEIARALSAGNLATRLAALELLREWQAPVESIDPWRPDTLSPEALAAVTAWAAESKGIAGTAVEAEEAEPLSEAELALAEEEIARLLAADSPAAAETIRERLARFGPRLKPVVLRLLTQVASDDHRERLLTLRYRLVASNKLMLEWPAGVVRLGSRDAAERRQAVDDLVKRAAPQDEGLLLELFSDADPLVRESSLRGLQQASGSEISGSLVTLLEDPEPNVRAAVLKQLAEEPSPALIPKLVEYIQRETDPDLVVHTIRALREQKKGPVAESLAGLLKHEAYQVRAEAAEALRRQFKDRYGSDKVPEEAKASACLALVELLDDADAFVVSRAIAALSDAQADLPESAPKLLAALERHPSLARQALALLYQGTRTREAGEELVRPLLGHEQPAIRAAAVETILTHQSHLANKMAAPALADEIQQVRIAAANSLFDNFLQFYNNGQSDDDDLADPDSPQESDAGDPDHEWIEDDAVEIMEDEPFARDFELDEEEDEDGDNDEEAMFDEAEEDATEEDESNETENAGDGDGLVDPDDPFGTPLENREAAGEDAAPHDEAASEPLPEVSPRDQRLSKFRQAEHRADWLNELIPLLNTMLASPDEQERLAAARPLTILGEQARTLPVLASAAARAPADMQWAGTVLRWLPWTERKAFANELLDHSSSQDESARLVHTLAEINDARLKPFYWELAARPDLSPAMLEALRECMMRRYAGEHYWNRSGLSARVKARVIAQCQQHIDPAQRWISLLSLCLMADFDAVAAARQAGELRENAEAQPDLRRDALRVMLSAQSSATPQLAVAALASPDPADRQAALLSLTEDFSELARLAEGKLQLNQEGSTTSRESGQPIVPKAPRGLQPQHLAPLLADDDPEIVARACYLLVLLGRAEFLPRVVEHWSTRHRADEQWTMLAYRAIAAANDAAYVDTLAQIFRQLHSYDYGTFYWTIRVMDSPQALRLRKQIRDEVGMDALR